MFVYFGEYHHACFNKQHHLLRNDYKRRMYQPGDCNTCNGFAITNHAECGVAIDN